MQMGGPEFTNCNCFDPLFTDHASRWMGIGRIRIFNVISWPTYRSSNETDDYRPVFIVSISLLRKILNACQSWIHGIVAYTFLNMYEKIYSFCQVLKDMHTQNWLHTRTEYRPWNIDDNNLHLILIIAMRLNNFNRTFTLQYDIKPIFLSIWLLRPRLGCKVLQSACL